MNIDCHIQAVRMASLKTLEFLFDTLGCNLDESLILILIAIIKTYPSMTKRSNLPRDGKVISFFADSWQLHTEAEAGNRSTEIGQTFSQASHQNLNRFSPERLSDQSQNSTFFSLNDIHSLKDCQVKDASLFHQSFIQTSKNFYNHILESMIFLISSTSTPILVRIFNEVIEKVLFQESIEQDLQIYLLRLSEKILQLCQGYVNVGKPFLNTLFKLILSRNSTEAQGTTIRGSNEDQTAKVANDLWQTLKSSYLLNQSNEGISSFISWVVHQFNNLTEKVTSTSTSGSSNKDSSDFNSFQAINQAQLRDATMNVNDQQKLLLLLDLTNLLIYGQLRHIKVSTKNQKDRYKRRSLQKLAGREALQGASFTSDLENVPENKEPEGFGSYKRLQSQIKLISLEMCQLIDPVIFWLNFTIERPDRLNFFKAIWSTLTQLVQILPKRRQMGIEIDCIQIIQPTLQRVETFCKTSSPSLEMLQFLIVVFTDIKNLLLGLARKGTKRDFFVFLNGFISTFSQNIPHNLHDEVFEVCSLLIDLVGWNGFLKQSHIKEVLEALVHKYTMRSKAHKRLSDTFLQRWILNQSLVQFEELKKLQYKHVDEQFILQRPRNRTSSNQNNSRHPIQFAAHGNNPGGGISGEINESQPTRNIAWNPNTEDYQIYQDQQSNSEEENDNSNFVPKFQQPQQQPDAFASNLQLIGLLENMHDQQQQQQEILLIPHQRASSQPSNFLQHANLAGVPNINLGENESTQANENGSNRVPNIEQKQFNSAQQRSLYFDTLCDFSLFQNFLPASDLFMSEQDQEQINFEKLSVLQDVIEALKEEHNSLFKRLLHHQDFNNKIATIFSNDRARSKIIKLMKSMTAYFLKYNSPKTFYEHPIVQTSVLPQPLNQPQVSARYQGNMVERAHGTLSQLQLGGQQLHSEPSLDILNVMNQEDGHTFTQEHIREQDLNLRRLNHHYSQHVERQQNFLFNFGQNEAEEDDSPRLAPSNVNLFLFDEVNLINNERLILIKTYTILIRIQIEQMQADQSQENASRDSQSQLQALNMMDMLLFSLCPVPSFQNIVIRNLLSPESGGYHAGGGHANNGSGDFSYQIAQPHKISFQFIGLNSMLGSQLGISSHEQYNDAIPDFETMLICDKGPICLSETQTPVEPNSFPKEFECWDIRYLHSRLALAFKFWPFVEQAMLNSSWNNVKASCQSVLTKVVQISDVSQMSANYQKRLKDLLFPLLNKLLKSQEGEGKACGLNILGSFCGLSSFQTQSYKLSFDFSQNDDSDVQSRSRGDAVFDSEQGQDYHYDRYEQRQKEALSRNQIKIKDHLHVFRRNSSFVSLAIWQEVFDLQENWNQQIRDAAAVLIQLCAPKDSVKHFKKMSDEKFQLRLSEAQQQLKHTYSNKFLQGQVSNVRLNYGSAGGFINQTTGGHLGTNNRLQFNSLSVFNGIQNHEMFSKQSSQQQLLSAHAGNLVQGGTNFSATGAQFNQDFNLLTEGTMPQTGRGPVQNLDKQTHQQNENKPNLGEYSDSLESSDDEEHVLSDESEIFFMEKFSERQLQQAISLFTSEFKPISGLWVDHTSESKRVKSSKFNRMGSSCGAGISLGSGALGHDDDYFFDEGSATGNPQQNLLIDFFEDNMLEEVASLDSKDDEPVEKNLKNSKTFDRQQTTSQSDGEDLGIIDLDKQEGSEYDDFDQLDDEKLPVLKNTYSKKNRPNNSKSVSIGSRSQGDVLRIRSQALQVLKAADEEIKVQIQERPEMLSGLQQSFRSNLSHEKKINADIVEERKRVLDDGVLHLPENNEWQSSLSESADRMQKKRRIQSGKAQSCLSEDQHIIDRKHSSQNSKTNSSNNSTPMEIGDIQITMHQEVNQKHPNQHYRMHDQMNVKNHEIRSQDNRKKRNVRQGQQIGVQRVELSENDARDKGFYAEDRAEYDVVSAPIKRSSDIREQRPSSGYKLSSSQTGKNSIDSLTELSSPYGDQDSFTRTFTQKEEEEMKRKFGTSSKKIIPKTDSQAKNIATKKQQQPNMISLSKTSLQGSKNQIHGSSSFLQTVSKQTLTVQQKQPISKMLSSNQSKLLNKEILSRSKQPANVRIPGQTALTFTQPQLKLILGKSETVKQSEAPTDNKIQQDSISKPTDDNQTHTLASQRLTSLHKPVLNSVHSQQVILFNTQKQPSLQTRQSSNKKQVTTRNSRNGAAIAQHAIQQSVCKDKRPNSLVLRHMPSGQAVIPKQAVKRNNYIAPQQSPRLAKKDGDLSQRSTASRGGQDKLQSRQAELIGCSEEPEHDQMAANIESPEYDQELDLGQKAVFSEEGIDNDSDPVEDLI